MPPVEPQPYKLPVPISLNKDENLCVCIPKGFMKKIEFMRRKTDRVGLKSHVTIMKTNQLVLVGIPYFHLITSNCHAKDLQYGSYWLKLVIYFRV